ncbi:ankyrin repeat domain-containing protein 54 [Nylanderia fulva]|uniref:ankyrin repeat domain-containing protein 54 n=1 Tax=Nylanderia fulva TaxID=613905 RepID=UPI0010FB3231|nr:ankyrin repeat domain-containing protein 54 [Nylanderia fulva]
MTSVDSGVETGNDSNDSLSIQHESQQQHVAAYRDTSGTNPINCSNKEREEYIIELPPKEIQRNPNPDLILAYTGINLWMFENNNIPRNEWQNMFQQAMNTVKELPNLRPSNMEITETMRRKMPGPCGINRNRTSTELLKSRSDYRAKIKSCTWCKSTANHLKDWQIQHIGRKMRLAATVNNTGLMSRLLNYGVSPNSRDSDGRTPLHHAACRGYTEMVQLLLENGANPNQRDCIGNTPLHLAAVTSKISVVTLLLKAGTDVLALDKYGYNPLQLAKAKLRMLRRNYNDNDMDNMKQEMHNIAEMILAYLLKQNNMQEQVETLSNFCSRLSLSSTSDQVQDDVKDLLAKINSLSI